MASLLAFISSYPYRQYPRNPTIRGRGDGRGKLYIGHEGRTAICDCPISILRSFRFGSFENLRDREFAKRLSGKFSCLKKLDRRSAPFGNTLSKCGCSERAPGPIHKVFVCRSPLDSPQEGQAV